MSRKGNCWDIAVSKSIFGILKNELIHHERFDTRQEAKDKTSDYIEVFYNRSLDTLGDRLLRTGGT